MAKTLYRTFQSSLEKQYNSGNFPLMALSAKNLKDRKIKFVQVGESNDGTAGTAAHEYVIQRMKRVKEKDLPNHNAKAGDEYINILNSAENVDYESITTKRSTERSLLISIRKGEATNALADGSPYMNAINAKTKNKLISKEERAVKNLVDTAIANNGEIEITAALTAANAITNKKERAEEVRNIVMDSFVEVSDNINAMVDDYKYDAESVALFFGRLGKVFSKEQGKGYQNGTNTFGDNFDKAFNYNGLDFFPETVLKSIHLGKVGDDTDKVIMGIVLADDAYQDAGLEQGTVEVSEKKIKRDIVGHIYDDLSIVLDKARVKVITATVGSLKTAGVLPSSFKFQAKVND